MRPVERAEGYAPIEDYAVLGDGRTVALLASDGRIDWWPFPALDSFPVLAGILDPERGGCFSLAPSGDYELTRRYLEDTNVVESVYSTSTGVIRVTVALNVGSAGRLPWTELVERVEGVSGAVDVEWEFTPGDRFRRADPWVSEFRGTPVASIDDQTIGLVLDGLPPGTVRPHGVSGTATVREGQRALLALVGTDNEPLFTPAPAAIDARLDRTVASWRRWAQLISSGGSWVPEVRRSALALKALIMEASGAVAAAATTSLPEGIRGNKNWDYRFSWIRDSSFTLDALLDLGLHEEVHGAVSWLLASIRDNGGELRVFYSLDGAVVDTQTEPDIPGYRHSLPVRAGNAASGQLQLGSYGDLFDTIHRYCGEGHLLDPSTGKMLVNLAERCCDRWRDRDSGMWELEALEHYTISKIGCWVALDRAVRLAEEGQVPDTRVERWRAVAEEIRIWIDTYCWSEAKRSFTFHAGTDDLDAAVLLAGRTGFERGARLASTIDAITADLARGPLLYRYTGMDREEGAFVACSFWMVEALAWTGQLDRARQLMDQAVALCNDLGLLSEQIDPATGAFLGNIPQGLSHLSLINAAGTLNRLSAAAPSPPS